MKQVTNTQIMEQLHQMDKRIIKLEERMNKGVGAVSVIAWLGGIAAVVGNTYGITFYARKYGTWRDYVYSSTERSSSSRA